MDNQKIELIELIKKATNILITVSYDPSVDQLASCIGLTLMLNKMNKHATAVFSGQVPPMLDFLQPNKTLEKNTDSLRDFIISLDRSKADKLRYKALDDQVKIYITPYKTSLTDKDLEFSQGDFNVDLVIVLGAITKDTLDQAIVAHGRILHDAAVVTIGALESSSLGSVNYFNPQSSSISEIITSLASDLGDDLLDDQIATSLLTGIVASTNRFSNEKTTSVTLSVSSLLMKSGADQQLVATKLSEPSNLPEPIVENPTQPIVTEEIPEPKSDGDLHIGHPSEDSNILPPEDISQIAVPQAQSDVVDNNVSKSFLEDDNNLGKLAEVTLPEIKEINSAEEPLLNNSITNQPMSVDKVSEPVLKTETENQNVEQVQNNTIVPQEAPDLMTNNALEEQPKVDVARDAVNRAFLSTDNERLKPIDALNAQPLGEISHNNDDPMAEHEIIINDNGEILKHNDLLNQPKITTVDENTLGYSHEKKLEPLHDLKKPLSMIDPDSINNLPPPVPPPIPVQFNSPQ